MQINYTIPLFLFLSLMQPMCADTSFSLDSQEGKKWQFTEADVQVHDYQEYSQEQKTSEIWQECEVPGNMSDYLSKAESGKSHEFWLKKVFELPNRLENKQLSIRLGIISDKDKTYLNGELIGSHGNFSNSKPEFYDKVRVYKVPSHLLRKGKNVILVHIKGFFTYETGIVQDKTEIGETDQVFTSFATESCLQLLLYAMYTTSGLYFLFLFLNRKKEKEYLYFALLTFCLSLYQFLRTQLKYELDIELLWLKKAEYMILATLVPFYANFIREFLGFRLTLLYKILNVGFTLLAIYFLLETRIFYFDKVNQYILQPLWFPYILSSIYYLVKRLQQGNREPLFIFAGMLFLLAATLTDIFSNRGFFVMPRTIPTGFACFVFSMALVLARKYVKLNMEIEELNSNLERKVCERTLELKQALEEVTGLKKQQDADYFLTSILLTPLTSNQNKSETVQTNFYSKQKKSFIFHNRQYEIGGDISITANAKFLGKDYTVFLNADAMGKSIQGAGGALVLGVVFNSILTRQVERVTVGESPRKWLKKVFVELQRVFESFGGSMYISCIIGLVENESGQVVFFNADHPRMVLLRQGKARFLESKIYLNKLGMPDNEDLYKTQSFYLSPGDVLFLGSDGKDDLCLREENGRRVINDDENLFLQSVERGKGDTEAIVADCLQQGTLTDDMTLVRIEFQGSIQHNWKTNCLQQTNGQKSPLVLNNKAVA